MNADNYIAASEDGDWYALDGDLTRRQVVVLLAQCAVDVDTGSPESTRFALKLRRGHIAVAVHPDGSEDEWYEEVVADAHGARPVWIAS